MRALLVPAKENAMLVMAEPVWVRLKSVLNSLVWEGVRRVFSVVPPPKSSRPPAIQAAGVEVLNQPTEVRDSGCSVAPSAYLIVTSTIPEPPLAHRSETP